MTKTQTRQSQRTPVTLKIKFKSATLDQFIERYAIDVSQGGIFIRTKDPLPVGTTMRFEFQLRDASPLITGEGTVVWIREQSPNQAGVAPGMGVRFDRLTESSQGVLHEILAQKAGKGAGDDDEPFAEQPTRVAPSPLLDGLAQESKQRPSQNMGAAVRRAMVGRQPVSSGVPFQSDANEFSEEAFEQATRVHSLDELAAASAHLDGMEIQQAAAAVKSGRSEPATTDDASDDASDDANDDASDGEELMPSQNDDRAQTAIFPTKRRLRPMIALDAALARSGRGGGGEPAAQTPDDAADAAPADGPGDDSAGPEGTAEGAPEGKIDVPALHANGEHTRPRIALPAKAKRSSALDAAITHELRVPDLIDEPTRESLLALEPVHPADASEAPASETDDELAARRAVEQQDEQPGEASDSTGSEAEDEARPATAQAALDGKPAKPRAAGDAGDTGEDDDDNDDNLTQLMQKPRVQDSRSGARAGLAAALVLLAGLGAGGYYFVFMRGGEQAIAPTWVEAPGAEETAQAAAVVEPPPVADDPAEEPAADSVEEPAPPPIETVTVEVRSTPIGALAELVDGAQQGPTPMAFELDESKTHRVRISHPGHVSQELTIDPAGSAPEPVVLQTAPWILRFTSTPAEAVVYVNGRRVPGTTPNEMELPPGWEKRKRFDIGFRLADHEKLNIEVANAFQAEPDAMVQSVTGTLVERIEPEPSPAARQQGGSSPGQGQDDKDDKAQGSQESGSGAAEQQAGGQSADQAPAQTDESPKPPAQQPAPSGGGAAESGGATEGGSGAAESGGGATVGAGNASEP